MRKMVSLENQTMTLKDQHTGKCFFARNISFVRCADRTARFNPFEL